ncbi:hypothetical protein HN695_01005 [Candidatus Woesearchaeota archaeon]|jgi:hypothetical protein|nr:hypothetical protein [Candidatus Woesearchaeota archaeon]MBT5272749.1 hypothetical protein [Candidatus Woesearchaeota archaeon]MBT6040360.1 hypothetical protein [Candidatus Woesearchaeota archaeon]MBT6337006.1 hypothetical protein [Candidatus Woesearchaeota archaeon]MBT7926892.1 hypothetical protein [Candidatus Woesearchaeota archaeon]
MTIKETLKAQGIDVSDQELMQMISDAKKQGKDSIIIQTKNGSKIEIKFKNQDDYRECGILD